MVHEQKKYACSYRVASMQWMYILHDGWGTKQIFSSAGRKFFSKRYLDYASFHCRRDNVTVVWISTRPAFYSLKHWVIQSSCFKEYKHGPRFTVLIGILPSLSFLRNRFDDGTTMANFGSAAAMNFFPPFNTNDTSIDITLEESLDNMLLRLIGALETSKKPCWTTAEDAAQNTRWVLQELLVSIFHSHRMQPSSTPSSLSLFT